MMGSVGGVFNNGQYEIRSGYYGGMANQHMNQFDRQQMLAQQNSIGSRIKYSGVNVMPQIHGLEEILNNMEVPQEPKKGIMKLFRDYIAAHRDTIFTLLLILLADHYVFDGAFSETIKGAFKKLLDIAHKKIDEKG